MFPNMPKPTFTRVALKPEQIEELEIPHDYQPLKKTNPNYKKFVELYGERGYELEAIPAAQLVSLLDDSISKIVDIELWNQEHEKAEKDIQTLQAKRERILEALKGA